MYPDLITSYWLPILLALVLGVLVALVIYIYGPIGKVVETAAVLVVTPDHVYQKQWLQQPVSLDSVMSCMAKVSNRLWVLHECCTRIAHDVESQAQMLSYGLRVTDIAETPDELDPTTRYTYILYRLVLLRNLDLLDSYCALFPDTEFDSHRYCEYRGGSLVTSPKAHLIGIIKELLLKGWASEALILLERHRYELSGSTIEVLNMISLLEDPDSYSRVLPRAPPPGHAPRQLDWCEQPDVMKELILIFDELDTEFSPIHELLEARSYQASGWYQSFTDLELIEWYSNRIRKVDLYTGNVEHCVKLCDLALRVSHISVGTLADDVRLLSQAVYNCGVTLSLKEFELLSMDDRLFEMSISAESVSDFEFRVKPILDDSIAPGEAISRLLFRLANNHIRLVDQIVWGGVLTPEPPIGFQYQVSPQVIEETLISIIYECSDVSESSWEHMNSILTYAEDMYSDASLNGLLEVRQLVHAAEIFFKHASGRTVLWIRDRDRSKDNQLAEELVRRSSKSLRTTGNTAATKQWLMLLKDLLWLQEFVMHDTTPEHCCRVVLQSILGCEPPLVKLAATLRKSIFSDDLDFTLSESEFDSVVLQCAQEFFNSSPSPYHNSIVYAESCLSLLDISQNLEVQLEYNLLVASRLFHEIGFDFAPIELRTSDDPFELISRSLELETLADDQAYLRLGELLLGNSIETNQLIRLAIVKAEIRLGLFTEALCRCTSLLKEGYVSAYDTYVLIPGNKNADDLLNSGVSDPSRDPVFVSDVQETIEPQVESSMWLEPLLFQYGLEAHKGTTLSKANALLECMWTTHSPLNFVSELCSRFDIPISLFSNKHARWLLLDDPAMDMPMTVSRFQELEEVDGIEFAHLESEIDGFDIPKLSIYWHCCLYLGLEGAREHIDALDSLKLLNVSINYKYLLDGNKLENELIRVIDAGCCLEDLVSLSSLQPILVQLQSPVYNGNLTSFAYTLYIVRYVYESTGSPRTPVLESLAIISHLLPNLTGSDLDNLVFSMCSKKGLFGDLQLFRKWEEWTSVANWFLNTELLSSDSRSRLVELLTLGDVVSIVEPNVFCLRTIDRDGCELMLVSQLIHACEDTKNPEESITLISDAIATLSTSNLFRDLSLGSIACLSVSKLLRPEALRSLELHHTNIGTLSLLNTYCGHQVSSLQVARRILTCCNDKLLEDLLMSEIKTATGIRKLAFIELYQDLYNDVKHYSTEYIHEIKAFIWPNNASESLSHLLSLDNTTEDMFRCAFTICHIKWLSQDHEHFRVVIEVVFNRLITVDTLDWSYELFLCAWHFFRPKFDLPISIPSSSSWASDSVFSAVCGIGDVALLNSDDQDYLLKLLHGNALSWILEDDPVSVVVAYRNHRSLGDVLSMLAECHPDCTALLMNAGLTGMALCLSQRQLKLPQGLRGWRLAYKHLK